MRGRPEGESATAARSEVGTAGARNQTSRVTSPRASWLNPTTQVSSTPPARRPTSVQVAVGVTTAPITVSVQGARSKSAATVGSIPLTKSIDAVIPWAGLASQVPTYGARASSAASAPPCASARIDLSARSGLSGAVIVELLSAAYALGDGAHDLTSARSSDARSKRSPEHVAACSGDPLRQRALRDLPQRLELLGGISGLSPEAVLDVDRSDVVLGQDLRRLQGRLGLIDR